MGGVQLKQHKQPMMIAVFLGVKGSEVQIFSPRLFNKGLTPTRVNPLSFLRVFAKYKKSFPKYQV